LKLGTLPPANATDREGLALANAISADLSVMRVSLWPGLLRVTLDNQRRQKRRGLENEAR
jgi:phenylalanyl-tRNA synthetase beta subunit